MKNIILSSLIILIAAFAAFGQEKSNKEERADKHFFTYNFEKAIDLYRHTKNLTVSGQRNLANSYQNIGKNEKARETYAKLLEANTGIEAEDHYDYAMLLRSNAEYIESEKWMDKFVAAQPADLRAQSYVKNNPNANSIVVDKKEYKLNEQSVNTPAQDFGTAYYQDKVLFVSSNAKPKMIKRKYNYNGLPYLNMYTAEIKDGQLENAEFFDKSFNAKYHDGPASFSNGGTHMVFTTNDAKDKTKDKVVELQLYFSSNVNGEWSEPTAFIYNNPAYSLGQPHLSEDGKTLYFTSDGPGGFGGKDLYVSTKTANNEWSLPINLGNVINTEGDEMFPFFEEKEKVLYFTSSGHFGLGGLDLFSSAQEGASWGTVINAGAPMNTNSDDFALIKNTTTKNGYISSNRPTGNGSDDIYAVDFLKNAPVKKRIEGIVMDVNQKPVEGAFVNLFAEDESLIASFIVKKDGAFGFDVESDKNFKLTGDKELFKQAHENANTNGSDTLVYVELVLLQEEVVEEEVIEVNTDLAPIVKMNNIYFDFDQSEIRPDAAKELDKIVVIMNKYPTMHVEIASHADCRGDAAYNLDLSDRRAKSSNEYVKARITNPDRISGKGYGETRLVNDCPCKGDEVSTCSSEQQQKNRRTEFIVLKK
jgi:outer membrane protein OmpA-like peptidoglycan-associated protein/tetratricopeptide (TPR) repeat protein